MTYGQYNVTELQGELKKQVEGEGKWEATQVSKLLTESDLALFDAGFSLIDAVRHGVNQCVVRLAKNWVWYEGKGARKKGVDVINGFLFSLLFL